LISITLKHLKEKDDSYVPDEAIEAMKWSKHDDNI